MASRNYHKRRTKERKSRQAAQRQMQHYYSREEAARRYRARGSVQDLAILAGIAHAPKMFVRDGKSVPFEYL